MTPSITLHHLNVSRSDRIFWLLEELKLPYNVQVHFRLPTRSAPPSLHAIAPLGRAPALLLDDELLTESAYIIHTLLSLPEVQDAAKKGEIDVQVENTKDDLFWSHFSEGSMMNLFQAGAIVGATGQGWTQGGLVKGLSDEEKKGIEKYSGWVVNAYLKPQQQSTIDLAEGFLAKGNKWFSGTDKPGESDFMFFFIINSLLGGTRKDAGYNIGPALRKWYETVMARPAAQKALQRLKDEEEKAKSKI
ncbi:hypothetical protein CI109_106583 [Kwoniella shandongensis]|uniref:Uncharacterized protein n=1 Tax=Kwoniella shandongensis TaxID=1734106 RepID=A0A5M6C1K5_9TREE|nr:uncharacterized protein CI109_002765 [Kwoniella shandongensis]KAA5529007.1 hypothetical protein CI109_002765 [Kwoniella shandongensis]